MTKPFLEVRTVERIVDLTPGYTKDDRLGNVGEDFKTLYHSVNVLMAKLEMSSYISNPQSARYGKMRPCAVYKVFDKISRILFSTADKKSIRIRLSGASYNEPSVYDSFETIAMILIENAVKYSFNNKDVTIIFEDIDHGVRVTIESTGILPEPDEMEKIFLKGYRGNKARSRVSSGSGLGLYIAKIIADAHNFTINYESIRNGGPSSKSSVGKNRFFFQVG